MKWEELTTQEQDKWNKLDLSPNKLALLKFIAKRRCCKQHNSLVSLYVHLYTTHGLYQFNPKYE